MAITTRDRIRQWSNLLLAVAQILITYVSFALGVSFDQATSNGLPDPPIVPAGYAFIIWSLIYAGSLAYAIYQFRPSKAEQPLFRAIGFCTAAAFLGTCCWLIAARFGRLHLTVLCIFWMALALYLAFRRLQGASFTNSAQYWFVVPPLSVFFGWASVAVFANTDSVFGISRLRWFSVTWWSVMLLCAAALLVLLVQRRTGRNAWYSGTVIWALIGIAVRNHFELRNAIVTWTALTIAGLLVLSSVIGKRSAGTGTIEQRSASEGRSPNSLQHKHRIMINNPGPA